MTSTQGTDTKINDLNSDFYDLTKFIKEEPVPSNYLWLPLGNTAYAAIVDNKLENHYYYGTSPIQLLTGKYDYSGKYSFENDVAKKVFDQIAIGQYEKAGSYFQKLNINYIIVNKSLSLDIIGSNMYDDNTYQIQQKGFYDAVLGEKIQDFGNRYSLYRIKDKFQSDKIFLYASEDTPDYSSGNVKYTKVAPYKYKLSFKYDSHQDKLTFLSPYHQGRQLSSRQNIIAKRSESSNDMNIWQIEATGLAEGSEVNITLYFLPQSYFVATLIISGTSLLLVFVYLIFSYKKSKIRQGLRAE